MTSHEIPHPSQPMISFDHVFFSYDEHSKKQKIPFIENLSLELYEGDILGILGPNGGGKSTVLKLILGELKPLAGTIQRNLDLLKQKQMSYIPQNFQVNLKIPITIQEYLLTVSSHSSFFFSNKNQRNAINDVLKKIGLSGKEHFLLSELSGGERQRVLLSQAYLKKAKLILLDEPTKGLDGEGIDYLLKMIRELNDEYKATIVLIDHNINEVLKTAGKILCLNGKSHWHNRTELLSTDILGSIYHCEFEHLKIHSQNPELSHTQCNHHLHHNHPEFHMAQTTPMPRLKIEAFKSLKKRSE